MSTDNRTAYVICIFKAGAGWEPVRSCCTLREAEDAMAILSAAQPCRSFRLLNNVV